MKCGIVASNVGSRLSHQAIVKPALLLKTILLQLTGTERLRPLKFRSSPEGASKSFIPESSSRPPSNSSIPPARRRRQQARRPRQPVPANIRECTCHRPIVRCSPTTTSFTSPARSIRLTHTSTSSTPNSALSRLQTVEKALNRYSKQAPLRRRRKEALKLVPCSRSLPAHQRRAAPLREASRRRDRRARSFLSTSKPMMSCRQRRGPRLENNPLLDAVREFAASGALPSWPFAPTEADIADPEPTRQENVPRRHGAHRTWPRPRHPRGLRPARPANSTAGVMKSALGRSTRATLPRRPPASSTPTSNAAFIRAQTIAYEDFIACVKKGAQEAGKMCAPKARTVSFRTATSANFPSSTSDRQRRIGIFEMGGCLRGSLLCFLFRMPRYTERRPNNPQPRCHGHDHKKAPGKSGERLRH